MNKLRLIKDYILYYLFSTSQHGVHSPFVYSFITQVLYNTKQQYYCYEKIESFRRFLKKKEDLLEIIDLGAGSHHNNKSRKSIKQIASSALKNTRYSQLLFRIADHFSPKQIIELGTSLGITTAYLSSACPSSTIQTIEGCPDIAKVAKADFMALELKNIKIYTGSFSDHFISALNSAKRVDLVYFDGDHKRESTLEYFNQALPFIHNDTVFIFDDIYWSPGMKQAWKEICTHPDVTVTIDLFQIGIVFFRKEQPKEHFKVRF